MGGRSGVDGISEVTNIGTGYQKAEAQPAKVIELRGHSIIRVIVSEVRES
jgi:hypothetical protein